MTGLLSLGEKPVLDLRHHHFRHVHAGIAIFGTWFMDPETRESDPCLAMVDVRHLTGKRRRPQPCIIPLADMWKWIPGATGDGSHCARNIEEWMTSGALPGSPFNQADVFRVMDAVQSRLRDLWSMPPLPPAAAVKHGAVPIGELTIRNQDPGEILHEAEVTR